MEKPPSSCDLCSVVFQNIDDYMTHQWSFVHHVRKVKRNNLDRIHDCDLCRFTCDNLADFANHLETIAHKKKVSMAVRFMSNPLLPQNQHSLPPHGARSSFTYHNYPSWLDQERSTYEPPLGDQDVFNQNYEFTNSAISYQRYAPSLFLGTSVTGPALLPSSGPRSISYQQQAISDKARPFLLKSPVTRNYMGEVIDFTSNKLAQDNERISKSHQFVIKSNLIEKMTVKKLRKAGEKTTKKREQSVNRQRIGRLTKFKIEHVSTEEADSTIASFNASRVVDLEKNSISQPAAREESTSFEKSSDRAMSKMKQLLSLKYKKLQQTSCEPLSHRLLAQRLKKYTLDSRKPAQMPTFSNDCIQCTSDISIKLDNNETMQVGGIKSPKIAENVESTKKQSDQSIQSTGTLLEFYEKSPKKQQHIDSHSNSLLTEKISANNLSTNLQSRTTKPLKQEAILEDPEPEGTLSRMTSSESLNLAERYREVGPEHSGHQTINHTFNGEMSINVQQHKNTMTGSFYQKLNENDKSGNFAETVPHFANDICVLSNEVKLKPNAVLIKSEAEEVSLRAFGCIIGSEEKSNTGFIDTAPSNNVHDADFGNRPLSSAVRVSVKEEFVCDQLPEFSLRNQLANHQAAVPCSDGLNRLKQLWDICKQEEALKKEMDCLNHKILNLKTKLDELEHSKAHKQKEWETCQTAKNILLLADDTGGPLVSSEIANYFL